jgi:hypothetical protein
MEVSGQIHAPAALPPEKEPQYPLHKRLGGPQSRSEHSGEERHLLLVTGFEPRVLEYGKDVFIMVQFVYCNGHIT